MVLVYVSSMIEIIFIASVPLLILNSCTTTFRFVFITRVPNHISINKDKLKSNILICTVFTFSISVETNSINNKRKLRTY